MDYIVTSKTPKLDLHGEVSSMVLVLVNDFINDNIIMGNNVVRIIHGKSSGILKDEVHRVLKINKNVYKYFVNSFNIGETIVYLKETNT